jgi:hypothetical protein
MTHGAIPLLHYYTTVGYYCPNVLQ